VSLRPSDIGELALAAVVSTAGASLAPVLPFFGVPLAALALGWLAYRRGYLVSAVTALMASAVGAVLLGSWEAAAFLGPALLAAGPGAAWALTKWPALRTILVLAIVLALAGVAFQSAIAATEGRSFFAQQRADASQAATMVIAMGKASGVADAEALKQLASESARTSLLLWPSSFAYLYGLAAALAVPIVSRMGRRLGRAVSSLPVLADLDLSLHIVWPAIAGLALLAAASFLKQTEGLLWAAGANLLLVARAPLFAQGLGDFAALYRKGRVGRIGRTFGFTFLTLSEIVIPSVSVVGLVDLFANLRKLPRGGSGPSAGLESGPGNV
jgi:hypothetical protein